MIITGIATRARIVAVVIRIIVIVRVVAIVVGVRRISIRVGIAPIPPVWGKPESKTESVAIPGIAVESAIVGEPAIITIPAAVIAITTSAVQSAKPTMKCIEA